MKLIKTIQITLPFIEYPIPWAEDGILIDFAQVEMDVMGEEE